MNETEIRALLAPLPPGPHYPTPWRAAEATDNSHVFVECASGHWVAKCPTAEAAQAIAVSANAWHEAPVPLDGPAGNYPPPLARLLADGTAADEMGMTDQQADYWSMIDDDDLARAVRDVVKTYTARKTLARGTRTAVSAMQIGRELSAALHSLWLVTEDAREKS